MTRGADGALWLVTGGARSGKSAFAERLVAAHPAPAVYVATMRAPRPEDGEEELRARIGHHRAARPHTWETVEEPLWLAAAAAAAPPERPLLIDCLALWVTNRLLADAAAAAGAPAAVAALEAALAAEVDALAAHAAAVRRAPAVLVTNEVGDGVVPDTPLGRAFRDLLGRVNQRASAAADRAWLLVAGRPLELPPHPGGARR